MNTSQISTVIFDCDGVLWDISPANRLGNILADYLSVPVQLKRDFIKEFANTMEDLPTLLVTRFITINRITKIFEQYMPVLKQCNISANTLVSAFSKIDGDTTVNNDALPVLTELTQRGYKLVTKSNWLIAVQKKRLTKHCLLNFFEFIQGCDNSYAKPNPKSMTQILGYRAPQNFIIIGDNLRTDIAVACDLRMHSIWLNEYGVENDTMFTPTYTVSNLKEVLNILK